MPKVCILKTDGINCDKETAHAFQLAGARAEIVHVNELRSKTKRLTDYAILTIPGGFSYGDDIASGRVLANELIAYFRDELPAFIAAGRLVLGICNGFQVLVRAGILPFVTLGTMQVSLGANTSGHFECRWVRLVPPRRRVWCAFIKEGREVLTLPVANGEGRVAAEAAVIEDLERRGLVALQYATSGQVTTAYPANPSGSVHAIAALCDPSGRVLGMMPHPERYVRRTDYPNWRRAEYERQKPSGLPIFENAVAFAKSA